MKNLESPPVTLALPTNTRMAADLSPLYDALKVSPKQGTSRTSRLPNTVIRFVRSQDIVRNLFDDDGTFTFGIAGNDTFLEEELRTNTFERSTKTYVDPIVEFPTLGEPTSMCLLACEERIEELDPKSLKQRKTTPILLTSYPNIALWVLRFRSFPGNVYIRYVVGGVERALRSGDYGPNAFLAVDIVRSGKTIAEEKLVKIGSPYCTSTPMLFEKMQTEGREWRRNSQDPSPYFNWRNEFLELAKQASIQTFPIKVASPLIQ